MTDRAELIEEQRQRIRKIDELLEEITVEQARAGLEQSRRDAQKIIHDLIHQETP